MVLISSQCLSLLFLSTNAYQNAKGITSRKFPINRNSISKDQMWKLASVRDEMRREYGAKFNTGDAIRLNLFAFYHKIKAKGRRSNKLAVSFL